MDKIIVQSGDFDLSAEVKLAKANNSSIGAIVSFVGTVRDLQSKSLNTMTLEHYPGMTEKSLELIAKKQEITGNFKALLLFIVLALLKLTIK